MPATQQELVALVGHAMADETALRDLTGFRWNDGSEITDNEHRDVLALFGYANRLRRWRAERRKSSGAQRKAMRFLRTLLSVDQRGQLSRNRSFFVRGQSGRTYRLNPYMGNASLVERHGKHYFAKWHYCLHDDVDHGKMPPADVTSGHLLLLLADESTFLATANATRNDTQLWNGEYLRRMRRRSLPTTAP